MKNKNLKSILIHISKYPVLGSAKSVILKCLSFIKLYKYIIFNPKEVRDTKNTIYLVYTAGKSGSQSVNKTLKNRLPHLNIFSVHFLSDEGLKASEDFNNNNFTTLKASKFKSVINDNPNSILKIISLVREPMSRDISDLFHNRNNYTDILGMKEMHIDGLIENFNKFDYEYALEWFDKEFKSYLNIDVFEYPFPHDKKYQIIRKGHIEILLMRAEDLSTTFCEAMKEFSKINFKNLINTNVGNNREDAQLYSSFKNALSVTKTDLDKRYNTKHTCHFYTEDEIIKFRKKWLK